MILGTKLQNTSRLLSAEMAQELYSLLPEPNKLSLPTLLFSTSRSRPPLHSLLTPLSSLSLAGTAGRWRTSSPRL
jgi:hypothetical protein